MHLADLQGQDRNKRQGSHKALDRRSISRGWAMPTSRLSTPWRRKRSLSPRISASPGSTCTTISSSWVPGPIRSGSLSAALLRNRLPLVSEAGSTLLENLTREVKGVPQGTAEHRRRSHHHL